LEEIKQEDGKRQDPE
jgi:hypothetical protein